MVGDVRTAVNRVWRAVTLWVSLLAASVLLAGCVTVPEGTGMDPVVPGLWESESGAYWLELHEDETVEGVLPRSVFENCSDDTVGAEPVEFTGTWSVTYREGRVVLFPSKFPRLTTGIGVTHPKDFSVLTLYRCDFETAPLTWLVYQPGSESPNS